MPAQYNERKALLIIDMLNDLDFVFHNKSCLKVDGKIISKDCSFLEKEKNIIGSTGEIFRNEKLIFVEVFVSKNN